MNEGMNWCESSAAVRPLQPTQVGVSECEDGWIYFIYFLRKNDRERERKRVRESLIRSSRAGSRRLFARGRGAWRSRITSTSNSLIGRPQRPVRPPSLHSSLPRSSPSPRLLSSPPHSSQWSRAVCAKSRRPNTCVSEGSRRAEGNSSSAPTLNNPAIPTAYHPQQSPLTGGRPGWQAAAKLINQQAWGMGRLRWLHRPQARVRFGFFMF